MSNLKGFRYHYVSLRKVQKDKFVLAQELEAQISRDELKKKMTSVLRDNGKVYFFSKKKEVCGAIIVRYEKHLENEAAENAYVLDGLYLTEELMSKETAIRDDILEELKEAAVLNDLCVKKIIWGDEVMAKQEKVNGDSGSGIGLGLCLGVVFGLIFDNLALGICLGLAIGCGVSFGTHGFGNLKKVDVVKEG